MSVSDTAEVICDKGSRVFTKPWQVISSVSLTRYSHLIKTALATVTANTHTAIINGYCSHSYIECTPDFARRYEESTMPARESASAAAQSSVMESVFFMGNAR